MVAPTVLYDNSTINWNLIVDLTNAGVCGYNAYIINKGSEKKSIRQVTVREPWLVETGTEETGEDGLGAGSPIGRWSRVRPLTRLGVVIFFSPKGFPQKRMAFVGKRKGQATGGIFCLRKMERCGLCVDENQGGTTVNFIVLGFSQGRFFI